MIRRIVSVGALLVLPALALGQDSGGDWGLGIGDWRDSTLERRVALSRVADAKPGIFNLLPSLTGLEHPIPDAQSPAPDKWFGPDKVRHFFTSALLQSLGYSALRAMDVEHGSALAGASVITAGFGIGKELRDRRLGYGFSSRDLVWDAAGAAAVSVLLARTER